MFAFKEDKFTAVGKINVRAWWRPGRDWKQKSSNYEIILIVLLGVDRDPNF